MARGAGLLFPDKRNAPGYRHLQEGVSELYMLNELISYTIFGMGNTLFFSPDCGKNNRFKGFFLTVSTGRLFCEG